MRFAIKGNFFNDQFHMPPTSGLNSVETIIGKVAPFDLSQELWQCPVDYRHILGAVISAQQGFAKWREISLVERAKLLSELAVALKSRREEFEQAIIGELGLTNAEAAEEMDNAIGSIEIILKNAQGRIKSISIGNSTIEYRPLGTVLVVSAFYPPISQSCYQLVSALLAGNSVIYKPSEKHCYSSQLLIEVMANLKLPKGVVNLLQGDGEMVLRLVKEKDIKGIIFTGTKEVGKRLLEITHQDLTKLVVLNLGSKNSCIIHQDADIELALRELLHASFAFCGQRHTSTSLVAIHESLKDQFIERFHELAKKIVIDHPVEFAESPFMGPLVDKMAVDNYLLYVGMAKREGFVEIMRGKVLEHKYKGYYVTPSIHYADSFNHQSHFLSSEILGPDCTFISYREIEQAIEIANASEFGLVTSVYTNDSKTKQMCLNNLKAGIVNFNCPTTLVNNQMPFLGIKNSGNYRPQNTMLIDACVFPVVSTEQKDLA